MQALGDRLVAVVHGTLKHTSFILQENIAEGTPIDTGRARGSWRLNEDKPDKSHLPLLRDNVNPISGAIIERAAPGAKELSPSEALQSSIAQKAKIGEKPRVIFISNTVPYIEKLEDGSSKQSPPGQMVSAKITPARVQQLVSSVAARLSAGPNAIEPF